MGWKQSEWNKLRRNGWKRWHSGCASRRSRAAGADPPDFHVLFENGTIKEVIGLGLSQKYFPPDYFETREEAKEKAQARTQTAAATASATVATTVTATVTSLLNLFYIWFPII